ncbi:urea ABC transporter substrate-binding protein [Halarchaeum nitratireducens]|uniref:Branched-chain amino acid ABC transporter substrate-binding protein n=1 Tax=Halarchaeum nitratireducens TaxID=489913 RepID=A0A830GE33_9EURY|nr:urea ABC transporter substrate-binding protein [Halarchaeum nitratireducens]GGN24403.1 branched-chain amino acid ABC transporter substrate-binding protein [Halarchaeum nitratireducens]
MTGTVDRRQFLVGGASVAGTALAGCIGGSNGGSNGTTSGGTSSDSINIGVLESRSGNFAINAKPKWKAAKLAIEEINDNGGILGRQIRIFDPDPQSSDQRYTQLARRLIEKNHVDLLSGAFASSSREAIRPTVDKNEQLYFYPNEYEGGLCDSYTFAFGSVPIQQYSTLIPYMIDQFGPKVYTIAADYNFGHISAEWIKRYVKAAGGSVVETEFAPLSVSDYGSSVNKIQKADPDFIATVMVGSNQSNFFKQKATAGLDLPMASAVNLAQSYEHVRFDPPTMAGMHSAPYYMPEVPTDRNQTFVEKFQKRWPDTPYIPEMAECAYLSPHIYKQAVEAAGATDQAAVIAELEKGLDVNAPEGNIHLKGTTHHMSHVMRLARVEDDHSITFLGKQTIEPSFLEEMGCDLTSESSTKQYSPPKDYTPPSNYDSSNYSASGSSGEYPKNVDRYQA